VRIHAWEIGDTSSILRKSNTTSAAYYAKMEMIQKMSDASSIRHVKVQMQVIQQIKKENIQGGASSIPRIIERRSEK
jgi:hypothetical protein